MLSLEWWATQASKLGVSTCPKCRGLTEGAWYVDSPESDGGMDWRGDRVSVGDHCQAGCGAFTIRLIGQVGGAAFYVPQVREWNERAGLEPHPDPRLLPLDGVGPLPSPVGVLEPKVDERRALDTSTLYRLLTNKALPLGDLPL